MAHDQSSPPHPAAGRPRAAGSTRQPCPSDPHRDPRRGPRGADASGGSRPRRVTGDFCNRPKVATIRRFSAFFVYASAMNADARCAPAGSDWQHFRPWFHCRRARGTSCVGRPLRNSEGRCVRIARRSCTVHVPLRPCEFRSRGRFPLYQSIALLAAAYEVAR